MNFDHFPADPNPDTVLTLLELTLSRARRAMPADKDTLKRELQRGHAEA